MASPAQQLESDSPSFNTRAVLAGIAALGLDVGAIREQAGIDDALLANPDAVVPNDKVALLWEAAMRLFGRPHFGLHCGVAVPFGAYEVVDYLVSSSATIGRGFHDFVRYFPLIGTGLRFEIDETGPLVELHLRASVPFELIASYSIEFTWAVVINRFHARSNAGFVPSELWLPHEPEEPSAFASLVHQVRTDPGSSRIVVTKDVWDLPQQHQDPQLRSVLARHAEGLLDALPDEDGTLLFAVRQRILSELRGGNPGIEQVAGSLGMSARTLQRRLKEDGIVYQQLVDELREGLARVHLRANNLSIVEVAYLLGYSDASAFNRAFKRWTGTTPLRFRAHPQVPRP